MSEKNNFIDYIRVFCKSGKGGAGKRHFARTKFNPMAGPDGGNGGRGGHIILKGNAQLWTLLHLRYLKNIHAQDGETGGKNKCTGKDGTDVVIEVPLGTIAYDEALQKKEVEILNDGEEVIWVKGGRGGLGNAHFATPTKQAPEYAQPGEPGTESWKQLELKILADVGLVGFPNAGKSTLLSKLSAATPKIADYAFTTLVPQLGIVSYKENLSFCMADLPGIIEGASEGKGLGYRFLRHIERNSVLLFMIAADSGNHYQEYLILRSELEKYNPSLLHKKFLVAISKSDLIDDELQREITMEFPKNQPVIFISSFNQVGINKLKDALWQLLH
ncbi:MAG: GTPase ObgE [Phycisphaerales bacterium]|nr:GTPase ObgE [Phycisphaerales bacterium]